MLTPGDLAVHLAVAPSNPKLHQSLNKVTNSLQLMQADSRDGCDYQQVRSAEMVGLTHNHKHFNTRLQLIISAVKVILAVVWRGAG